MNFFIIYGIGLIIAFLAANHGTAALRCYVGTPGAKTEQSNCNSCQTTTTAGVAALTCSASCTASFIASVNTTCCQTNLCNGGGGSGGGGSGGGGIGSGATFECYVTDGSKASGCNACQKTVVKAPIISDVVTKYCIQSPATCTETGIGLAGVGTNTYCCTSDMCNSAGHNAVGLVGLLLTLMLTVKQLLM